MTVPVSDTKNAPSWKGLSSDDKPTNAPEGSSWLSIDTGEQWWFRAGMWVYDVTSPRINNLLR